MAPSAPTSRTNISPLRDPDYRTAEAWRGGPGQVANVTITVIVE